MKKSCWLTAPILLVLLIFSSASYAAYCSLRDPAAAIHEFYGRDTSYRSIISSITNDDRLLVKQHLPFTLHRSEVGKHTLYVIYQKKSAVGFVQARSELSEWGLMEIAWSINLDMTVMDFFYQRCRGSDCELPEIEILHELLAGKNFEKLRQLLSEDGTKLAMDGIALPDAIADIAILTIRSALKTIAITRISWSKKLQQLQTDNYEG
jgi:hypothetical protein